MKNCIGILGILLLFLLRATAFCQSGPPEGAITGEEYAIYRLALERLWGSYSVDKETLDGVRADRDPMTPAGRIHLDADIINDFNEKNLKKYTLSEAFILEMAHGSGDRSEGRKKATFSRIGFDRERRHALLLIGTTLYYPEDVMNEGKYVFLEKQKDKWMIRNTTAAWNMRLGLIR